MLAASCSYRDISRLYGGRKGLSKHSLSRHRKEHIPKLIAVAAKQKEAEEIGQAQALIRQADHYLRTVNQMLQAAHEWLLDPETGKYDLEPRAGEITVQYSDYHSGKQIRRKAKLSELLRRIQKRDKLLLVTGWNYSVADPRDLLLKAVDRGARVVELLGRLSGDLKTTEISVVLAQMPEWRKIVELVVSALPRTS